MKSGSFYNIVLEKGLLRIGDAMMGTCFMKKLEEQRRITRLNETELTELSLRKLDKLLEFATTNVHYYKQFRIVKDSNPEVWLKRFPLLTKSVLRSNTDMLMSRPKSHAIKYLTSGSSGIQTEIFIGREEESILRAILINWWEWSGYWLGKPIFQTGITPERGVIKTVKDFVTRTTYQNAFGMSEKEVLKKLHKMEGESGYHLGGFASSLYVLAEIAKKHGVSIQFDGAISWGDKLFKHYKDSVEDVFKTKVFENYGLNEGFMVGQKKDLPFFYIYTPNIYLEILDKNGNEVPDGEMGHVVLTKLDGYAMPLIRYSTGDLAVKLRKERYPQKRDLAFPLLERVIGRDTDLIKTPDGKILIVHSFTGIFEFFPQIRQFKIIQHQLDNITIEFIPSESFVPDILNTIEKEIHKLTGSLIEIDFKEVNNILPSKSGKPQIIESTLNGNIFI